MRAAAGIRHSRLGRAFVAIAGSEDAARALGIDVARYKLLAFLISAFYAAVAGSLFVHAVGFVSPEVYGLHMVVLAFTMLYVGGIGTIAGAALGALVIGSCPKRCARFSDYQDLAYGALLILILIYAPGGLASLSRLSMRAGKRRTHEPPDARRASRSRFGGLVAVDDVSLDITAGRHHRDHRPERRRQDDAVQRRSRASARRAPGRVAFDGDDITGLAPERAARRGLVRTFQLVQLFETLTVLENVKVGRHLHTSGGLFSALMPHGARAPSRRSVEDVARDLLASSRARGTSRNVAARCPTARSACSKSPARSRPNPSCSCSTSRQPDSIATRRPGSRTLIRVRSRRRA